MSIMYFFIEFSIPWIMKWSVEVNTTSDEFPYLQQIFYTKSIALYMEEVKKDLMRNLDIEIKDDISMASASHTNDDDDTNYIAREGQDDANSNEEIDIEALSQKYQQKIEESSNTNTTVKGKNKE
ncbi:hypothetical protein H5410_021021 [Solanum commersonii]|uniref:Uncharacterized protein n=1 Tax=Solanum commersonii TaxID=4109 RepID=A0A9J5ZE01_SOLCO|nr:hypothetical protein H5410_021021 [Solanum commersonii]